MNNLQDLIQFRSNFAPVMNELAARTDSRRLVVSANPRRLRNRLDIADQQTPSMYNENISRKDYYSMGDSYIHNNYRTAVENDGVRNANQCPQFPSHLAQPSGSPLSVIRQRRPLGPRSQTSPNTEFDDLEELHRVIRGLKPVNIPKDNNNSKEQDCQPGKAAPELHSSNVQDYQPWKAAPELLSSRDLAGNKFALKKRSIAANCPRRSDVPVGAIVSLSQLQTAIQLLKPVSKVSNLTENSWNQSLTPNERSSPGARCDLTTKTVSIKQEELKDQKNNFKTNPITVKELELRIQSLKRVGSIYYPHLKTTFYDDMKEKQNEKLTKDGEQTCDHLDTCDEICKVDTDEDDVVRKKKTCFLSRPKFWSKGSKEIKQTKCEVMTSENSDKGQENGREASKEKTPSKSAKNSSLFSCCVKGVSTDDSI